MFAWLKMSDELSNNTVGYEINITDKNQGLNPEGLNLHLLFPYKKC